MLLFHLLLSKSYFSNLITLVEAQKAHYFLNLQDNHFTEQHRTHGIICVHAYLWGVVKVKKDSC